MRAGLPGKTVDESPLRFEDYRQRRAENAGTVRCARCGEWITATATRCPECGVHFQGEAQYFTHPSEQTPGRGKLPKWVLSVVAVLLGATVLVALVLQ